jgi:cell cycle checkpoint control protein RAD9A
MPVLSFTLSEEGVGALRDALACLTKFSDDAALEARKDKVSSKPQHYTTPAYCLINFYSL